MSYVGHMTATTRTAIHTWVTPEPVMPQPDLMPLSAIADRMGWYAVPTRQGGLLAVYLPADTARRVWADLRLRKVIQ